VSERGFFEERFYKGQCTALENHEYQLLVYSVLEAIENENATADKSNVAFLRNTISKINTPSALHCIHPSTARTHAHSCNKIKRVVHPRSMCTKIQWHSVGILSIASTL